MAVHAVEWLRIKDLRMAGSAFASGFVLLRAGLGVEVTYYLLTFVFLVLFLDRPVLIVLVLLMVILHLAALQDVLRNPASSLLSHLRGRRILGLLVFDLFELTVLIVLAVVFGSLLGVSF